MAKKVRIKGKLKLYFTLLLAFGIILAIINIPIYILNIISGVVISVFLVIYFVGIIVMWIYFRQFFIDEMVSFATEYGQIQKQILKELNLPHALLDHKGKIVWTNGEFEKVIGSDRGFGKPVSSFFEEMTEGKAAMSTEQQQRLYNAMVMTGKTLSKDPKFLACSGAFVLAHIISALFADYFCYAKTLKDIRIVRENTREEIPLRVVLYNVGGTSVINFICSYFLFSIVCRMLMSLAERLIS